MNQRPEGLVSFGLGGPEIGVPREWVGTMRAAIGSSLWQFSTARMLTEYVDRLYLPVARGAEAVTA